jgi:hypothetical protein
MSPKRVDFREKYNCIDRLAALVVSVLVKG